MDDFAAFIGIDWANDKHDLCLVDCSSGRKEFLTITHKPEALDQFLFHLRTRFAGQLIAVALEQARGPLIFALLKYDFLVLYPVHTSTLAKYREAFSPSRAKDDPKDAEFLVELITHHRDRLKAWAPDDPQTRTLQMLVEHRRRLVGDRTRISNRLTALLKSYFPQVLDWFPDIRTTLVCHFLLRWPTLEALKRARPSTLEAFFRAHRSARQDLISRRIEAIKVSLPLVTDHAVINSSVLMVKALVSQMQITLDAISSLEDEIETLSQSHQDFHIFASLPGSGTVYASRLLVSFGARRDRFTSAHELACFSGIAPVIERSGHSTWVRWRYFCPKFLRQSFHEYAGESIKYSLWAKAFYWVCI